VNSQQPAPAADVAVTLELKTSAVEFIVNTLNANPLHAPVMTVAKLINDISDQVRAQINEGSTNEVTGDKPGNAVSTTAPSPL